ncbi:MAG: RtcB family protein [Acidimicrobiales bacterium]
MVTRLNDNLYSWASILDEGTIQQAERTARLPILAGHVALMADAHIGIGATVGSVVPTRGAIIPSCVGVDIGCGMAAVKTSLTASDLPDNLDAMLPSIERAIPAGVGQGNKEAGSAAQSWMRANPIPSEVTAKLAAKCLAQLGSLGSGNHFAEVSVSTTDDVWVVLHSGSRGIGNELARRHIDSARKSAVELATKLEDRDLAWLAEGTPAFMAYVADLLWPRRTHEPTATSCSIGCFVSCLTLSGTARRWSGSTATTTTRCKKHGAARRSG